MKFKQIIALLLTALLFCSCGTEIDGTVTPSTGVSDVTDEAPVKQAYPVSIYGETFNESPSNLVSLSPALTQMLYDLGSADKLVGISEYCTLEGYSVQTVGSPANPDIEKIISCGADTLVTLSPLASTDVITLDQAGIKTVVISEPASYAELCEMYINLAMMLFGSIDSKDVAYSALEVLDKSLLEAKNASINISFICVEGIYGDNLAVSGKDTIENDILGVYGNNLLAEYDGHYISKAEAGELSPEVVFLYDTAEHSPIERLYPDALIVRIDANLFERPCAGISAEVDYCTQKLLEKLA